MKKARRNFIKQTSLVATAFTFPQGYYLANGFSNKNSKPEILQKLSELNDKHIEHLLEMQINDPNSPWHGGLSNAYDIPNAHSTYGLIVRLGNSYASPYSDYFQDKRLEKPLEMAAKCLCNVQYEDGTIDLYSTNFHSTPDTAFVVNYLSPIYKVLKEMDQAGLAGFLENMSVFLGNTAKCLAIGGIHTPNHRWVVCSALAWVNSFFPDPKLLSRIDEWLSEGIDQDPDGQYTEQSVSIYSPVCDDMFLTLGKLLNRPDLLEVVRKNLDMTLYYIQPGGEVLTDASNRQDNAKIGYVSNYYYAYRYFALMDKNPTYAAVCALIEQEMPEKITRYISELLEDPIFENELVTASKIPDQYFKRFKHSGVFRIRNGITDLSVIEGNPTFMTMMVGSAVLQSIRIAAAFFGWRGQFTSQEAKTEGNKIILTMSQVHGYFQPYPEGEIPDADMDMDGRPQRKMSEVQKMNYKIEISEKVGQAIVDIQIDGTKNVPVSMELSFRDGGELKGVTTIPGSPNAYFLESGFGKYTHGNHSINFGPGKAEHKWAQIRGMLPKQKGESVYITGYTPFNYILQLN
ncbi:hypothetical protein [Flexithrix dorotheae]|uniref:hypothetical protein n=1 Tax=Flexithrix dorotheae TaxID=70993 RepID=UPI00036F3903|nr:hypothetical protein [Flexithrix dorotheae]